MKVSQVLADQLRAAGINVEVQQMTSAAREPLLLQGDYDISFQAFCPGYIAENLDLFNDKNYVPLGENAPWFERNSFRYNNPEFSAIVDQMMATSPDDQETMMKLFHDAMAHLAARSAGDPPRAGAGAGAVQLDLLVGLAIRGQRVEYASQLVGESESGAGRFPEPGDGRVDQRHPAGCSLVGT